jgi:hypothetical protein
MSTSSTSLQSSTFLCATAVIFVVAASLGSEVVALRAQLMEQVSPEPNTALPANLRYRKVNVRHVMFFRSQERALAAARTRAEQDITNANQVMQSFSMILISD